MASLGHKKKRVAIIDTCLEMNRLGVNQGTSGNVSVRTRKGLLITPSGIPYDKMTPEQIVPMDANGAYYGDVLPSSEWRMHYDIFRNRPEAGAVVHTHSTYATALACLHWEIPAFHYMIGVSGGTNIRCAPYAAFGTQELSELMIRALEGRTACLLGNHGQICFGPSLEKALWLAVEVETLAKQYWVARQCGKPALLKEEQMADILVRFKSYGKQPGELPKGVPTAVAPPQLGSGAPPK